MRLLGDVDEAVLAELSEELDGNYTWDEITKRFNEETRKEGCTTTVFRFCYNRGWLEVCDKYVTAVTAPLLSASLFPAINIPARVFLRYVQYCGAS